MSSEYIKEQKDFYVFMQILLISVGKQEISVQGKADVCFLSLVHVNNQNKICNLSSKVNIVIW